MLSSETKTGTSLSKDPRFLNIYIMQFAFYAGFRTFTLADAKNSPSFFQHNIHKRCQKHTELVIRWLYPYVCNRGCLLKMLRRRIIKIKIHWTNMYLKHILKYIELLFCILMAGLLQVWKGHHVYNFFKKNKIVFRSHEFVHPFCVFMHGLIQGLILSNFPMLQARHWASYGRGAVTGASSRYGDMCSLKMWLHCGYTSAGKLDRIKPWVGSE